MSKKSTTLEKSPSILDSIWNVRTLEYIELDVFNKQEIPIVRKMTDMAFLHFLRSEVCDDLDIRNQALDSWFANSKTQTILELKELPHNVLELRIHHDI